MVGDSTTTFSSGRTVRRPVPPRRSRTASLGETMFIDADKRQRLMTIVMNAEARAGADSAVAGPLAGCGVSEGKSERANTVSRARRR